MNGVFDAVSAAAPPDMKMTTLTCVAGGQVPYSPMKIETIRGAGPKYCGVAVALLRTPCKPEALDEVERIINEQQGQ